MPVKKGHIAGIAVFEAEKPEGIHIPKPFPLTDIMGRFEDGRADRRLLDPAGTDYDMERGALRAILVMPDDAGIRSISAGAVVLLVQRIDVIPQFHCAAGTIPQLNRRAIRGR